MPRVLIVDDEPQILRLYRDFFEEAGFEVVEADNIREAARLHWTHKPDAVILDVSMRDGGALELLPALRDRGSQALAFVVTGYLAESVAASVEHFGAGIVYKADGPRKLVEVVRGALAA